MSRPLLPALLLTLLLAACATTPATSPDADAAPTRPSDLPSPKQAADNFVTVIDRVEPVAEAVCRERTENLNCDYLLIVDSRRGLPPNAFQTVLDGRPVIAFTIALIAEARNQDELAFILGHEAAHHIAGHIPRARQGALRGAVLAGVAASLDGASDAQVRRAQAIGAEVGARRFSKAFELEADALGTIIAFRAGFDPQRGAAYFARIPDPGNVFLGSHPPNEQRFQTVQATLARMR